MNGCMIDAVLIVGPRPAPLGKRPCAFPRPPFAASVKKIYLMGAILNNDGLRSASAAELRRTLHSRPQCSGALGNPF